jgi:Flp pilus assembly protein protease CpaA
MGFYMMIVWGLFGLILMLVCINDFLFFRIEDELIIALLTLYAVSCLCCISGKNIIVGSATAIIVFLITWGLNRFNFIGGGDVKLLFPLILFAENDVSSFFLTVSVAGIALCIVYMCCGRRIFLFRKKLVTNLLRKKNTKHNPNDHNILNIALLSLHRITVNSAALKRNNVAVFKQEIPYGIALSLGGFYVVFENLFAR